MRRTQPKVRPSVPVAVARQAATLGSPTPRLLQTLEPRQLLSSVTLDLETLVPDATAPAFEVDDYRFADQGWGSGQLTVHGTDAGYASTVLQNQRWNRAITLERIDGEAFDLLSLDYGAGRWNAATDANLTGTMSDGTVLTASFASASKTLATLSLGWTDLTGVVIDFGGPGTSSAYGVIDNLVVDSASTEPRPGRLAIDPSSITVNESDGTVTLNVLRTSGSAGTVGVSVRTVDGTATAGTDYTALTQTLSFADGQTSQTVTIALLDDAEIEGSEGFAVELFDVTGGADLGNAVSQVRLTDNDLGPTVTIDFESVPAGNAGASLEIDGYVFADQGYADGNLFIYDSAGTGYASTVLQNQRWNRAIVLTRADGDAFDLASLDYAAGRWGAATDATVTGTLADGSTLTDSFASASKALATLDLNWTGLQSVVIDFAGGATSAYGAVDNFVLATGGDDPDPTPGAFRLDTTAIDVNEDAGSATLTIQRINGSDGAASVRVSTGGGSATPDADYTALSQVIDFADGQTQATVSVPILDDGEDEADETFTLTLSNATTATLDSPLTATVTILDDDVPDEPGVIQLVVTSLTVNEDDGSAQIPIERVNGSDGIASVFLQTVDDTAVDGSDYTGSESIEVVFADGQTSAFAVIPLINDGLLESVEAFSVSLFRTEEAGLGAPRTAIVTIVDDEAGRDLVGHWRLDESSLGQSVDDASDFGNDGTFVNLVAPAGPSIDTPDVDSPNPGSIRFDGVDDHISIAPDPSLDLSSGGFTQSVWIRSEITDNAFHGILGHQGTGGTVNRYPGIWVYQGGRVHAGFGDGSNWNSFTTGDVLTAGEWNHVATTFDGTTYRAFVNGVSVFTTTDFAGRSPVAKDRVDIGRVDNYFPGLIDDVRIYNRPLSPAEIIGLTDGADLPDIPTNGQLVTQAFASGLNSPVSMTWLADGRMLVLEKAGIVKLVNTDGSVRAQNVLDIRERVNNYADRGFLGFTLDPDFATEPYLYATYTYDPPEVQSGSGAGGPDGNGARVSRISRFTVDPATFTIDPDTEMILVGGNSTYDNIGSPDQRPDLDDDHSCEDADGNPLDDCIPADETSHTIGDLEFGPDGYLYASTGDGGSFGRVDPINLRSLDVDSLAGKILRIDPDTGLGADDNPFHTGDGSDNASKVYQYGLRNPYRFAVSDQSGQVAIGDVGWTQWEEVNIGDPGANFGWPAFEGGSSGSLPTGGYQDLSEVQAYYATNPQVTDPAWARLHSDGGRAIIMGDYIDGSVYPAQIEDRLLFTDIGDQVIRAASFDANGNLTGVESVSAGGLGFIVDIQMGPDGFAYATDIGTGVISRLIFSAA